jgi:hypothetical protein
MDWKKWATTWAVAIVVGFYTTFVLKTLWNWFAVPSLHVSEVSFWMMYGISMLVSTVVSRNDAPDEERFKRLAILINACVPEHKREEVREDIDTEEAGVFGRAGIAIAGKVLDNSLTLGVGWAVHMFLA